LSVEAKGLNALSLGILLQGARGLAHRGAYIQTITVAGSLCLEALSLGSLDICIGLLDLGLATMDGGSVLRERQDGGGKKHRRIHRPSF
jgi:hypothetical protein